MIFIMIAIFIGLILLGVPIVFSMAFASIIALLCIDMPVEMFAQQVSSGINSFPFLSIPFFILAGNLMETGGIAKRLIYFARGLIGHIRGGLGMVVVVAEMLFSGISGSSLADASAIGSLMVPAMKEAGYPTDKSICIITAASGAGILIPPCINMVLLAVIADLSVGALFVSGFLPGLCMGLCLMGLIYYQAGKGMLPKGEKRYSFTELLHAFRSAVIPLLMPVIIFGGILGGVATATEVAVLAVIYALIVGVLYYKEIKISELPKQLINVVKLTGSVMFLTGVSLVFSWVMTAEHVPEFVGALIKNVTNNPSVFLLISNLTLIFFTGLMDGLPALLIFYPIFRPIAADFGVNQLHFALLSIASCGIGLSLPPIGLLLIVVSAIGNIGLSQMIKPMIPYIAILIFALLIIMYFPWITLVLPRILFPLSGF